MYYPYSEKRGSDQLLSYCEADLRLCFRKCLFSHDAAQIHTHIYLPMYLFHHLESSHSDQTNEIGTILMETTLL